MDGVVNELTARAAGRQPSTATADADARVFIGLVGAPGSGKSTLAREIVARVNAAAGADVAVVFPMDGFHYYLSQLAERDAVPGRRGGGRGSRRGAPWTFDADAFVRRVADAKRSRDAVVRVPEFDHEVHDPEEDKIAIAPTHKIVVVEGNYLTLPDAPWSELHSGDAPLLDEVWHLDCSVDDAMAEGDAAARRRGGGARRRRGGRWTGTIARTASSCARAGSRGRPRAVVRVEGK